MIEEDLPDMYAFQDECLLAIQDGEPVPAAALSKLPPWRAVMIGRVAARSQLPVEGGTLDQLVAEAIRVGGYGSLTWPVDVEDDG